MTGPLQTLLPEALCCSPSPERMPPRCSVRPPLPPRLFGSVDSLTEREMKKPKGTIHTICRRVVSASGRALKGERREVARKLAIAIAGQTDTMHGETVTMFLFGSERTDASAQQKQPNMRESKSQGRTDGLAWAAARSMQRARRGKSRGRA